MPAKCQFPSGVIVVWGGAGVRFLPIFRSVELDRQGFNWYYLCGNYLDEGICGELLERGEYLSRCKLSNIKIVVVL